MKKPATRQTKFWLLGIAILLVSLGAAISFDLLRPSNLLYQEAQQAPLWRANMLYQRLEKRLPQIEEYFVLASARQQMPAIEAVQALQAITVARPHSPTAYEAHLILARYYRAIGEAEDAEKAYRAALDLEESSALRAELARYLADIGRVEDAYDEYRALLRTRPDSFVGMRLTGTAPLAVAADFNTATYYSDALEELQGDTAEEAILIRAEALSGLGRFEEAAEQYQSWLEDHPDDVEAQSGLAGALESLGQSEEALEIYQSLDTPSARTAEADLIAEDDPERAVELYTESDDPIGWWNATAILEESDQIAEAIDLYEQVARSGIYLADDAAYRMLILAQRAGDSRAKQTAHQLLNAQGVTYLGLQAQDQDMVLPVAPPYTPPPQQISQKVNALEELGLDDLAQRELEMAARFNSHPEVVAYAAQSLADRGDISQAQSVAEHLLYENRRRPLMVWQLAYPKPYADMVETAAHDAGVDPLLVWAVMREESRFDPDALSFANAQGLMQIIPSTRDSIAEQSGEEIQPDSMFDPETAIRFGAFYLGSLIDLFDGDVELAIAAYNGGPGSVQTWRDDPMVRDRDDFYRWIGFGETREYLSRVMLSYAIYQHLETMGR
jgi:soluble lytic murein transglycosylase